jgi:RNA polymerase sigma factor (sigma-70 family)
MAEALAARTAAHPRLSGQPLRVLSDEKLAALATAGSDEAFATLYGRHHQPIYRYCLSLLRQEADARDALQSSMLAALSALRARPIEGSFKPWLFRIAHNESISIIRGRARQAPTDAPPTEAFNDDPETREQLRTLVSDLEALPDRQRGAIVMRELSGLSYTEIGAALGISEAAGKQLVYEARSALHELREGHEMSCELVRERISARDRRLLRGRKVRAHLRGCQPCQDFEQAIRRRRGAFALLAPPLSPLVAAGILRDVLAGGGASGGAGGAGGAVGVSGAASGGAPMAAAPLAAKLTAAVLLAGGAAIGAYQAGSAIFADAASRPVAQADSSASAGHRGRDDAKGHSSHAAPAARVRGKDRAAGARPTAPGTQSTRTDAGTRSQASQTGDSTPSGTPGGSGSPGASQSAPTGSSTPGPAGSGGPDSPGAGGSGSSAGGTGGTTGSGSAGGSGGTTGSGSAGGSGGSTSTGGTGGGGTEPSPSPAPTGSPEPAPPPGGGETTAPPGTPPGHGGVPPSQGGVPPGQAGSSVPPGQINNPGHGGGH